MVVVTFEEVTCRGLAETNDKYRLVLFASDNRKGELRSAYRHGSDVFGWKSPFKDPVAFGDSNSPLRISIELRKKGWLGRPGRTVCSYVLELDRDCQSRTVELVTTEDDIHSTPRLLVTVTASGLAAPAPHIRNPNGDHTPDAEQPALALHSGLGSSNVPDPSSPRATTTVPIHPLPPTLHVFGPDDPQTDAHFLSSDLPGSSIPGELSTEQGSAAAHSPRNRTTDGSNDGLLAVAQNALDEASRDQSSLHSRSSSVLDLSTDAVPPGADAVGQAMWSGVSRLDAVVRIVAIAADIHPLVKGAWSLLNVAYTLAKDERELDLKIEDLVHALDTNCEFARVLAENQLEGAAASIVAIILREVLKGASLIKEYCTTRRSTLSVIRFASSTTSARVDACLKTLDVFRRDLGDQIAAGVHRDLQGLQRVAATLDCDLKAIKATIDRIEDYVQNQEDEVLLKQMPYASEADRALVGDGRACLPETRREIIEAIVNWAIGAQLEGSKAYVQGLHPSSRVLWLCGVAGSGKSSIAISVARALRSMDRLGALYGFETAFQATLNPTNLISTIALQHAERRPARKEQLVSILRELDRPARATSSPSEQFRNFLASTSPEGANEFTDIMVIDAFDESGTVSARAAALSALSPNAPTSVFPTSIRFIVTSRYDPDIAERLESAMKNNPSLISLLHMEDIHPPDTERDIKIYVTHMLGSTRGLEASRAAGDLARLAVTAQHSFQWASSASRYIVDADDHDGARLPAERLQETLATRGGLDKLYLSILDRFFGASILRESEGTRSLRMILGCLVCASEPLSVQTIAALASADPSFSTADETSFHILARKLSSIITGTKDTTTPLVAFHTSFTDFLSNKQRSDSYAVSAPETHLLLALASLAVMKKLLRFNICHLESLFLRNNQVVDLPARFKRCISSELSYACRFWPVHVAAALSSASPDIKALHDSFSAFLESKSLLLQWLEVMSLTGTNAYETLGPLMSLQAGNRDLSDLITFTTYFSIPIGTSVPHIYLSALAFAPTSSLIITPSEVNCVAFSPNGRWVVSGSESGEISVWDVYLGSITLPRMSASGAIKSIAMSRDGNLLASGSKDGTIQIWDMRTLSAVGEPVKAHTNWVWSVAFSPNGTFLASGSSDDTIRLWDLQSDLAEQRAFATQDIFILSVAFSPDGKLLASGSSDQAVRLWDVPTLLPIGEPLRGHTDWVRSVIFSPNGTLVSASDDKTLRFWDVQARSAIGNPLTAHDSYIHSVVFSPDDHTLASCSEDKTVRIWDVRTRSPLGEPLTGHTGTVQSIAFSPNGTLLASGSSDKTVHIWNAHVSPSNRESPVTQFKIQNFAAFSRDGKLLASSSDGDAIQLWDVHSVSGVGEPLSWHTDDINCVTFSPDGRLLASGSDDKTVRLWDVSTASAAGEPLEGHSDSVRALIFSPDGKLLASASNDGSVRLWDIFSPSTDAAPLAGHATWVLTVVFSPDGTLLACGTLDHKVHLWDMGTVLIRP